MNVLGIFRRCTSGNVAMIFAVAVVPIMLAVGAGVDMVRMNLAQTQLQAVADAAALSGGASPHTTEAQLQLIAMNYLDANGADRNFTGVTVRKIKNNKGSGIFSVEVKGELSTSFMALAGIPTVAVRAISEVKRGSAGPLEMVLALDTTYSMSENDKIGTLKIAATELVNAVMVVDNVKVGVVPFADYFKVGLKYRNAAWLDVPPDKTEPQESCDWNYPDKTGCSDTCYADGVPYSCPQGACEYWGTPVKSNCTTTNVTESWQGCVAARPEAYHASIADAVTVKYPGRTWGCGAAMLALTNKKGDVLDAIDALWPSGNTHIPSGLIWAWNMLTPEEPLSEALPQAEIIAKNGKRVMVLMTDGANTVSPYFDGNYGNHEYTDYGDSTYTDNLTASLCNKIKAEGTIVYTVLFDVTDANIETLLRNCASDPAKSYVADDAAQLLTAFADIGAALTKLRLTR